ncbi:Probable protein phosphatase 2C 55 [Striga hermonthica]|uniref:Protein phosphatase n=1 Tax=Striga hermonthica TaxID=68872 RepID=A0A9N7MYV0_STRHE|nr:Probable protein phosphatase 2C 55 [Striga hermonthica]
MGSGRNFSSSCHSNGIMPEGSSDGSLITEHLSSLALSVEERSRDHSSVKLLSGSCYMPHPDKEKTGGEDAHFICADEQVVGVADGVGGWADVGVNSGDYARQLMSNSVEAIRKSQGGDVDPLNVLEKAHAATSMMGSSTACIVALKSQNLHAVNIGDSGFIVIRDGRTVFESPVQQHGFNCPYQLERGPAGDLPSSGQVFKVPVVPGDVVVAGSDGLFDNLYNKEIATIVADAVKEGFGPDATARKIAEFSRIRALDRKCRSPFSVAAEQAGFAFYGGKLDDLTVVVSYVSC